MRIVSFSLLVLLVAGCGGSSSLAPVSGRVTLNGQPLAKAAVVFQPIVAKGGTNDPGPGSGGFTDADGRYTLTQTGTKHKGAVLGKHKVQITRVPEESSSADDQPKKFKQLPSRYNGKTTTLEFEVLKGGTDSADFPLKEP
jgi:hypothetical protein